MVDLNIFVKKILFIKGGVEFNINLFEKIFVEILRRFIVLIFVKYLIFFFKFRLVI